MTKVKDQKNRLPLTTREGHCTLLVIREGKGGGLWRTPMQGPQGRGVGTIPEIRRDLVSKSPILRQRQFLGDLTKTRKGSSFG